MKSFLVTLCIILLLLVLAVFSPWQKLNLSPENIIGKKALSASSLEVTSLGGKLKVSIDGNDVGSTALEDPKLEISPVEAGNKRVKIVRDSTVEYDTFDKELEFVNGISSVIAWEIGPNNNSSNGWILTPEKKNIVSKDKLTSVRFVSDNQKVDVYVDNKKIDGDSIKVDPLKQYNIKVEKEGYLPLNFQLFGFTEDKLKGIPEYDFVVETKLAEIPLKVIENK